MLYFDALILYLSTLWKCTCFSPGHTDGGTGRVLNVCTCTHTYRILIIKTLDPDYNLKISKKPPLLLNNNLFYIDTTDWYCRNYVSNVLIWTIYLKRKTSISAFNDISEVFPSSRRLQLDVEKTTEIYCVIMTFSSDTILDFTTYTNKSDLQQKNASLFIKVIFSEIKKQLARLHITQWM